jgi:hypothetical protein
LTYERMINFRISLGLSSSSLSVLPLIAFFITSRNDGVNGTVDSGAEFD